MPVVIYRQPWFWAVIIAVVAVLGFVVVIAASNRDRAGDSTTIVQQPAPSPSPNSPIVPVPSTGSGNMTTPQPAQPEEPVRPERPAEPAQPTTPQVKERVIVKEKAVPVPVPVPSPAPSNPMPSTTPPGPSVADDEFQNTGLQRTLRFNDATWRASSTVPMDESQLRSAGISENSTELFVETNAREPFTMVYVPIPDQEGMYVRYNRR